MSLLASQRPMSAEKANYAVFLEVFDMLCPSTIEAEK